jgi:hypothetical protein
MTIEGIAAPIKLLAIEKTFILMFSKRETCRSATSQMATLPGSQLATSFASTSCYNHCNEDVLYRKEEDMRKLTSLWPFLWLLLVWLYVVIPFSFSFLLCPVYHTLLLQSK